MRPEEWGEGGIRHQGVACGMAPKMDLGRWRNVKLEGLGRNKNESFENKKYTPEQYKPIMVKKHHCVRNIGEPLNPLLHWAREIHGTIFVHVVGPRPAAAPAARRAHRCKKSMISTGPVWVVIFCICLTTVFILLEGKKHSLLNIHWICNSLPPLPKKYANGMWAPAHIWPVGKSFLQQQCMKDSAGPSCLLWASGQGFGRQKEGRCKNTGLDILLMSGEGGERDLWLRKNDRLSIAMNFQMKIRNSAFCAWRVVGEGQVY